MANSDIYGVLTTWTVVQVNGADLTDGTFSMESLSHNRIDFQKKQSADPVPLEEESGHFALRIDGDNRKVDFTAAEVLYAKHRGKDIPSNIGVIPA